MKFIKVTVDSTGASRYLNVAFIHSIEKSSLAGAFIALPDESGGVTVREDVEEVFELMKQSGVVSGD